jgi:hypothetical protein
MRIAYHTEKYRESVAHRILEGAYITENSIMSVSHTEYNKKRISHRKE